MTRQSPTGPKAVSKVDFWESLTGSKLEQDDPRVHRFYRTVDCVFNHKSFFGNIQADNRVSNTSWDFNDDFMWKAMSPTHVQSLPTSKGIGYLQPSTLFASAQQLAQEEKNLEQLLRDKIGSVRMNEERLTVSWDSQLSYLL